ncbi:hypothetical protein Nepgr_008565 [Nepenthes gracilis]|uniref:Glycosyltransferase n=1 Tax=Nepenthes gracilis TaxID=150966 RepID=A0AAD3S8X9_NEPGR|nr:hypothetical protein Nepgr_008565 [Nepenthes gracilis]
MRQKLTRSMILIIDESKNDPQGISPKGIDDVYSYHYVLHTPPIHCSDSSCGVFVRRSLTALLLFAAVFFVYWSADSLRFLPNSSSSSSSSTSLSYVFPPEAILMEDSEEHSLEKVLKDIATEDKTVIITTINEAWAAPNSIVDLFLESFRIGDRTRKLMNHLVIVALDQKAYKRCLILHAHCFSLATEGVNFSREAYFMTPNYLKMMWRRIGFLLSVLEMGYNFVFTDADVMWFRDPFTHFHSDGDFQIACDHFSGNSLELSNRPNGGFNYVKSNNRTIKFYEFWYSSQDKHPGCHDQDVLNIIKYDPFVEEIGLKMRFLDTAYFGGLCEPSRDFNQVCTMHANCCVGMNSKLYDLRIMLQDWRLFMAMLPALKRSSSYFWRVPKNCSLGSFHHPSASVMVAGQEDSTQLYIGKSRT